ncbi:uncharacterized protein B0P05DRAFT_542267 [Gilbertella persicaria]|uniref:uncharacterized protein n=1 Tax=Gilbertella persicaria TaxID=101096 RepID=UPI00221EBDCC|nr:uncharacterized protein B0P05DRAFT_542267 [Gilbertella persicaria]KAI8079085.1 hypothetical protein B0P05DRAFT_542267 [Gilbertella persicaria]
MMEINYITIYDNTPEARVLFVSESVTDVLGWQPEELLGNGGYGITHPDERHALALIHSTNVKNERLSSVTSFRSRHKQGHYINTDVVIHYCYDVLIATHFAVVSADCIKHKMRTSSADEAYVIQQDGTIQLTGAWNNSQQRIKKLLTNKNPWNIDSTILDEREPRFCLFLNRYTSHSTIVFATNMCLALVGMNPFECIGESLLDYVSPKDRESVAKQIELSKSSDMIARLRFDWIKPDNTLAAVEAVCSSTFDGIVMVVRLIPVTVAI